MLRILKIHWFLYWSQSQSLSWSQEPELELYALARDSPWDANGILALRAFIDHTLAREWKEDAGFVLTYDLRDVGLKVKHDKKIIHCFILEYNL